MKAIETTGHIDKQGLLKLDEKIKLNKQEKVKVIILINDDEELEDDKWVKTLSNNSAFDFLNGKEEDIYSLTDGRPFKK